MDTIVIEARTKSDARFLKNFSKRIGAKVVDTNELLEDMVLGRLIEVAMQEPNVCENEILEALKR
jgi:hypothetical protein